MSARSARLTAALATVRTAASRPAMRRALTAYGLFRVAEMATWVALLVWAYDRGGATAAGVVAVAQLVPATLTAPLASVLTDRLPRARALQVGYLLQAIANLATAAALFLDVPFWAVTVLAASAASAVTLTRPVHNALLPEIARTPEELTAGNAASTGVAGIGDSLGPVLASGILLLGGAGWVFLAMGATGVVSAWLVRRVAVTQVAIDDPGEQTAGYWRDAAEGLRVVLRDPGASALTAIVTGQFVVIGLLDILGVVLALSLLGAGDGGPGLLAAGLGLGALLGAAGAVTLLGRGRLGPGLAVAVVVTCIPLALVPVAPNLGAAVALFALIGAGNAAVEIGALTLLQRSVPPRVLSRILGVQEALMMGGTAIGAAIAPILVAVAGARGAFVIAAVVLPVVGLLSWRQVRGLEAVAPAGDTIRLLRSAPLFALLPLPQLEQLAGAAEGPHRLAPGELLLVQGEPGDRCYVVAHGTVVVERDGAPIARLGRGEVVGEIALLRDVPRTATCRADDEVEVYSLERGPFLLAVTGSEQVFRATDDEVRRRLGGAGPEP